MVTSKRFGSFALLALVIVFGVFKSYPQSANNDRPEPGALTETGKQPRDKSVTPFRYIIFTNYVFGEDDEEADSDEYKLRRVETLMEAEAFNKENLILFFKLLSERFPEPCSLEIKVHTSLLTIETPEEREAISDHTSREPFENYHKTALYRRFNDCSEAFSYATGKPPAFLWESIKSPQKK